ncbi:hypothetical protein [Candidatus Nitrospira bockiana]
MRRSATTIWGGIWGLVLLASTLLLHAPIAPAQTGALTKDPTKLLQKYLDLDIKGARLNSLSREAQRPYVAWKEEPVWGQIVVISGYEITDDLDEWHVIDNVDVVIPVTFKVLGSVYLEQATFLSEPRIERVDFHVKAVNGLWRVVDPMLPPHVGTKRITNYVRQALLEESDPARATTLTALRDELKKLQ